MGKGGDIYNTITRECRNRGIAIIPVMEIMVDSGPQVYHGSPREFLNLLKLKGKELYIQREVMEDEEFGPELDMAVMMFMHNGVANILELDEEGLTER